MDNMETFITLAHVNKTAKKYGAVIRTHAFLTPSRLYSVWFGEPWPGSTFPCILEIEYKDYCWRLRTHCRVKVSGKINGKEYSLNDTHDQGFFASSLPFLTDKDIDVLAANGKLEKPAGDYLRFHSVNKFFMDLFKKDAPYDAKPIETVVDTGASILDVLGDIKRDYLDRIDFLYDRRDVIRRADELGMTITGKSWEGNYDLCVSDTGEFISEAIAEGKPVSDDILECYTMLQQAMERVAGAGPEKSGHNDEWRHPTNYLSELKRIREHAAELGGKIDIDPIDEEHLNCLWYGGEVASVDFEGYRYSVVIKAIGNVLLEGYVNGTEVYVHDRHNKGDFSKYRALFNDRTLSEVLVDLTPPENISPKSNAIYIRSRNRYEFSLIDRETGRHADLCEYDSVLDNDLLESLDHLERFKDFVIWAENR